MDDSFGLFVDYDKQICMTDVNNQRIRRWTEGARGNEIVIGGNGSGQHSNQLSYLTTLAFDTEGNLYAND